MRATSLGHATWLFETEGGRLLSDPVLHDPFEQGAVTNCPSRELTLDAMPAPDALYISHRHLDHYDFPTLDRFDRALPIFCPDDPYILWGLQKMGFSDVRIVRAFEPVDWNGTTLTATPSDGYLEELGLLIQDSSGALFNQVDTNLTPDAIMRLRAICDPVDVHLAMFACQDTDIFMGDRRDTRVTHEINLNVALSVGAKLCIPASGGLRFVDRFAWLNRHVYPISPEMFVDDLTAMAPIATAFVDPGDVIVIGEPGGPRVDAQAATFVRRGDEGREHTLHDPSAPIPALVEDDPQGLGADALEDFVDDFLQTFVGEIQRLAGSGDEVVIDYFRNGIRYGLEIVLPDRVEIMTLGFEPDGNCDVNVGPPSVAPHIKHRILSSALHDLVAGTISMWVSRAMSRRASQRLLPRLTEQGAKVARVRPTDLLAHIVMKYKERRGGTQEMLQYFGLAPPPAVCRGDAGPPPGRSS